MHGNFNQTQFHEKTCFSVIVQIYISSSLELGNAGPMATTRNAARQGKPPSGVATIRHILDGNISEGALVNIVGIVTDFRAPIPTRGKGRLPNDYATHTSLSAK